jgi:hypothetical protein
MTAVLRFVGFDTIVYVFQRSSVSERRWSCHLQLIVSSACGAMSFMCISGVVLECVHTSTTMRVQSALHLMSAVNTGCTPDEHACKSPVGFGAGLPQPRGRRDGGMPPPEPSSACQFQTEVWG